MLKDKSTTSKATRVFVLLIFLSTMVVFAGCSHFRTHRSTTFASHKVSVNRHGPTHRFGVENRGQVDIFHYDGHSLSGVRFLVRIENDKVFINDKNAGMLKQGDSVLIRDEGLTVNSLDYGQTTKYLESNARQETAQNVGN